MTELSVRVAAALLVAVSNERCRCGAVLAGVPLEERGEHYWVPVSSHEQIEWMCVRVLLGLVTDTDKHD